MFPSFSIERLSWTPPAAKLHAAISKSVKKSKSLVFTVLYMEGFFPKVFHQVRLLSGLMRSLAFCSIIYQSLSLNWRSKLNVSIILQTPSTEGPPVRSLSQSQTLSLARILITAQSVGPLSLIWKIKVLGVHCPSTEGPLSEVCHSFRL